MRSLCLLLFYCHYAYYSCVRSDETFSAAERRAPPSTGTCRFLLRFLGLRDSRVFTCQFQAAPASGSRASGSAGLRGQVSRGQVSGPDTAGRARADATSRGAVCWGCHRVSTVS